MIVEGVLFMTVQNVANLTMKFKSAGIYTPLFLNITLSSHLRGDSIACCK
jgi:hypothetical protein